jgi:Ca2+-binding EF-hand superfamily protein
LGPADINFLYDNLDKDKSGKISYREMMDAFKGHTSVGPVVRERIRERLIASGKYSGVTPSDIKK